MSNQDTQTQPVVLGLDASGDQASVALWRDGGIVDHRLHAARHGHAATLVPMVQEMMQANNASFSSLTHIAGGTGPGSFTGIRVALAGAKGVCVATKARGIGVSVLAAQAHYAAHIGANDGQPMVILTDTRRGSVYGQSFDHDAAPLGPIFESAIDELAAHVATERMPFAFGGMASDQAAAMLGGRDMASLAPADARHITMLAVNQIAHHQLHPDQPLPPLTPLYLAPAFLGPKKNAE